MGLHPRFRLRLTYDIWRRLLPRYVNMNQGPAVLECGTGPGNLMGLWAGWFSQTQLYGLDLAHQAIGAVREICRKGLFMIAAAESMPFPDQKFDILLSLHMIEHLKKPEYFVREAARVLRPGGIMALATPNPEGLGARLWGPRWSGYCADHISLHTPEAWRKMLTKNGFAILQDGTTGLSGILLFRRLPFALINWVPLFVFGFFPWSYGEADICISSMES